MVLKPAIASVAVHNISAELLKLERWEFLPIPSSHPAMPSVTSVTCCNPLHSCSRNISSFKKVPGRGTFKKIGRALQQFVSLAYPGKFSLCNLNQARMTSRLSDQAPVLPPTPFPSISVLDVVLPWNTPPSTPLMLDKPTR